MSSIRDLIDPKVLAAGNVAVDRGVIGEGVESFSRGVRAGGYGAAAGLNALAGSVGENVGLEQFARDRYGDAQRLSLRAQQEAPEITSYKDVDPTSLRSMVKYAGGVIGQSVPSIGVGLGTALLTRGAGLPAALAAGTLAQTPLEAGDIALRNLQDPEAMKASAGERLQTQLVGGAGSAALQSVVPGIVAGKVLGKTASTAAKKSAGQIIGRAGTDMALESATEAGGEVVKQGAEMYVSPNRALDLDAVVEAGVGGLVGGAPMAGLGAAGEALHSNGQQIKSFVGSAADRVKTGAQGVMDRAKTVGQGVSDAAADGYDMAASSGPAQAAKGFVGSAAERAKAAVEGYDLGDIKTGATDALDRSVQAVSGLVAKAKDKTSALADRVASGEDFFDPESFAGKTEGALKAAVAQDGVLRQNTVTQWAEDLWKANMTAERRAELQRAMADLSDKGNQAVVAGMKKAKEYTDAAVAAVTAFKDRASKLAQGDAKGKPSLDYAAADKVAWRAAEPLLSRHAPGLLEDPDLQRSLAPALRSVVTALGEGRPVPYDTVMHLMEVTGPDTIRLLADVHKALSKSAQGDKFFAGLNQLDEQQQEHESLAEVLRKSLPDDSKMTPAQLRAMAHELKQWSRNAQPESGPIGPDRLKFVNNQVRRELEQVFGDKAEAVLDAVDASVKKQASRIAEEQRGFDDGPDPDTDQLEGGFEERGDPDRGYDVKTAGGKLVPQSKSVYENPARGGKGGFAPAAQRAIDKIKALNPHSGARWASFDEIGHDHPAAKAKHAELTKETLLKDTEGELTVEDAEAHATRELSGWGMVVDEASENELALTSAELKGVLLDTNKHSRSAARIESGDVKVDAVKLTRLMRERLDKTMPSNGADRVQQAVQYFKDGMAALQAYTGEEVKVQDSTVIEHFGHGATVTWGDARKLDTRTEKDKAADADTQGLTALRAAYRDSRDAGDRKAIADAASSIVGRKKAAVEREQAVDDGNGVQRDDKTGFEGGIERGINVNKGRLSASLASTGLEIKRLTEALAAGADGSELGPQMAQLQARFEALTKQMADEAKRREWLGTGQQEFDPFGPTFQNGHNLDEITGGRGIGTDGGDARTGAKAPSLLGMPKEGSPDPKAVAAKKAAFQEKARSGDAALLEQLRQSDDAKGLQRAAQALYGAEDANSAEALDAINARLSELVQDPDTAYGMTTRRYSLLDAQEAAPGAGPRNVKAALDYIHKVLRDSVDVDVNAPILHAGEFEAAWSGNNGRDTIRLSVHSLNPLSAAFHESMHAFVERMFRSGNSDVVATLTKAASSPSINLRLRTLLKDSPAALAQLSHPEERVAYMYQFHAAGIDLGLGAPATNVFTKIGEFIRSLLGIWSNDQRALHIMDHFQSGEYAKTMDDDGAVRRAVMDVGRNRGLEMLKNIATPVMHLGENLAVAGHQRLRDTGIPALVELADMVKLQGTESGDDAGYLPASRLERTTRMNALGDALGKFSPEVLDAAREALQRGEKGPPSTWGTPEQRLEARAAMGVVKTTLRGMKAYMDEAGVIMGDLGPDYFPRVYDPAYISRHQAAFSAVLVRHGVANPEAVIRKLMTTDGAEFNIEVDRPGMQHSKERSLGFIPDSELAPFVLKDMWHILNNYVTQGTRRAEWARRFGEEDFTVPVAEREPTRLQELLTEAKRQGAEDRDLDTARNYLRAVDGTLGDTINPEFRRLQGNVMVYQNIRLLPLAIFSSVVDPVGIMVRGGTMSDALRAFKRGVAEIPKGFKEGAEDDEATQMAQLLGTIDSAVLTHTIGTSFSQGMVGDTGRKINDWFFRFNLMEQFNTSMRVAATEAALSFMARHADGTAGQHSTRWIAELGFAPGELRKGPDGKLLVTENDGLTAEQAFKVRVAVNRWVDGAVLRPDAADKAIWMNDPHFALISHLKQFTFSFHETILKRVAHEMRNGNMTAAYALASYVPIMMASDLTKGLIQGGGDQPAWKRNWGAADYIESGVERAGLLGVHQFTYDAVSGVAGGKDGLLGLLGPTIEQMAGAARVAGGREQFGDFFLKSMPANALYAGAFSDAGPAESRTPE